MSKITVTVKAFGQTREVEAIQSVDNRLFISETNSPFVGQIGAGKARYPAAPFLLENADGTYRVAGAVVIRNRPAMVVGWADTLPATNAVSQQRTNKDIR